ncbi:bifunctional diguanylate cyclase/phosphodiesterase [Clostridium sp. CX1]|uniref:bifunctional diguanylate cyclase/phosphodiesterase n=1 Tax=Clostridium sp. CX1 TaxID=2978346 RepID=UPI0021BF5D63|nr:bifunctional diguanylate cyclase/phosphodiesterase [Clostridium sp. CX1]MCT8975952.1 bifunctional diguanylate cyclase/phosphodiesterase [Clostridium sp. CX1]
MTMINKTAHTIIISTLIFMLVLSGISNELVFKKFSLLENKIVEENINRAKYALDREVNSLNTSASDWAAWDETYEFIQNKNKSYIDNNLVDDVFTNYKINFMIFINEDGKIIYSRYFDLKEGKKTEAPAGFENYIIRFSNLTAVGNQSDRESGTMVFEKTPIMVSSAPIITSSFSGPVKGRLIIGRYLNEKIVESISEATTLKVTYSLYNSMEIANDFKEAKLFFEKGNESFTQTLNKEAMGGYALIKDIQGKPILILKVEIPREVYKESINTKIYFFALLILVFVIGGAAILWILKYKVLLPGIKQKQTEEKLYHVVYFDQLTGLPNRLLFLKCIEDFVATAKENSVSIAILYLDINRFKIINDIEGYDAGDKFLRDLAEELPSCLGEDMILGRLGEDEFGILMPKVKSEEEVLQLCDKIIASINRDWKISNRNFNIAVCIGIAVYPQHGETALELLKNADAAMYYAKERGKNYYEFYKPALSSRTLNQVSMENSIIKAINREEFILYYQSQIRIVDNKVVGVEALIRWHSPEHGIVPPDKFIPFAEENGLIDFIDRWVMKTACLQSRRWQELNKKPIRISVNVSSKQFEDPKFIEYVRNTIDETKADPAWLEVEITESALMKYPEETIKILNELKSMGIKIALDDFGTGYSSLAYLKKFPIDKLKIDKSFIRDITQNKENEAIVKTIIDLSKSMGIKVVAEGVETKEQLEILRKLNCDEVQGYLFSKPVEGIVIEEALIGRVEN